MYTVAVNSLRNFSMLYVVACACKQDERQQILYIVAFFEAVCNIPSSNSSILVYDNLSVSSY